MSFMEKIFMLENNVYFFKKYKMLQRLTIRRWNSNLFDFRTSQSQISYLSSNESFLKNFEKQIFFFQSCLKNIRFFFSIQCKISKRLKEIVSLRREKIIGITQWHTNWSIMFNLQTTFVIIIKNSLRLEKIYLIFYFCTFQSYTNI